MFFGKQCSYPQKCVKCKRISLAISASCILPSFGGGRGGGVRRSHSVAFPRQRATPRRPKRCRCLRQTGRVHPLSQGFTYSANGRRRPQSPTAQCLQNELQSSGATLARSLAESLRRIHTYLKNMALQSRSFRSPPYILRKVRSVFALPGSNCALSVGAASLAAVYIYTSLQLSMVRSEIAVGDKTPVN